MTIPPIFFDENKKVFLKNSIEKNICPICNQPMNYQNLRFGFFNYSCCNCDIVYRIIKDGFPFETKEIMIDVIPKMNVVNLQF